jgi:hypothetical protein
MPAGEAVHKSGEADGTLIAWDDIWQRVQPEFPGGKSVNEFALFWNVSQNGARKRLETLAARGFAERKRGRCKTGQPCDLYKIIIP